MYVDGLCLEGSGLRLERQDDAALLPIGIGHVLRVQRTGTARLYPTVGSVVILVKVRAESMRVAGCTGAPVLPHLSTSRVTRILSHNGPVLENPLWQELLFRLLSVIGHERYAHLFETEKRGPRQRLAEIGQ